MMGRTIEIFGKDVTYTMDYEVDNDIRVMRELQREIMQPQILSYEGLETIRFRVHDDRNNIGYDLVNWIYRLIRDETHTIYIRDCLLAAATEDKEWTERRNRDYNGVYYRKITFNPYVQDKVVSELALCITKARRVKDEIVADAEQRKADKERRRTRWTLVETYKDVKPTGGETGRDGYRDATYRNADGEILRFVSRDVFDFGAYSYPKRVEGTDDVLRRGSWSDVERDLADWLYEFVPFHGIRM